MKVLFLLHGMPPLSGRAVVGAGLRAFALGEGLRQRQHRVFYATRHVDLPEDLRAAAETRRKRRNLALPPITGPIDPPGDPMRSIRTRAPIGVPPEDDGDVSQISMPLPAVKAGAAPPFEGLAALGGSLGSPGNPFPFTETHEVHDIIRRVDPDVVVVEALEEARRLPEGRFATVVDLYAPRILEQQFQPGADEREAVRVLDALQRGDWFLFSNERQKYFHLPLLALAGIDCTRAVGDVVPLSAPPDVPSFEKPAEPLIVAGGVFWPWADLGPGLVNLLAALDQSGRGQVALYGGRYGIASDTGEYKDPRDALDRGHNRLDFRGLVPIEQLWDDYRRASFAFDVMAPNAERELNLSFRQIDYLRCGLPIITTPGQVIARELLEYGAGWVVEAGDSRGLTRLITDLFDHPDKVARASSAAQRLVRDRYAWDRAVAPLDAFVRHPLRRERRETVLTAMARTQADLWEEQEDTRRLREGFDHLRADVVKKDAEIQRQDESVRSLMATVDRLTRSIEEIGKFKNAAMSFLGESKDELSRDAAELRVELERRDLDLQKRGEALGAAQRDVARLQRSLTEVQAELTRLEARFVERDGVATAREEEVRGLQRRAQLLEREIADRKREVDQRDTSIAEAARNTVAQEQRLLEKLDTVERRSQEQILEAAERWRRAEAARVELAHDLDAAKARVAELEADLDKKEREVLNAGALRERDARSAEDRRVREIAAVEARRLTEAERAEGAVASLSQAESSLLLARDELGRLRVVGAKKAEELRAAEERLIDARGRIDELQATVDRLDAEGVRLRGELARLGAELHKKRAEAEGAEDARLRATSRGDELAAQVSRQADELMPLRAEAAALRVELAKKRDELDLSERRRIDAAAEAQGAQASLDQRAAELSILRTEEATQRTEAAKAREALEAAQRRLVDLGAEAQHGRARLEVLDGERAAMRAELTAQQAALEKKTAEVELRESELTALRNELTRGVADAERRALVALERAEVRAHEIVDDLKLRLEATDDERGRWRAKWEDCEPRRREAERQAAHLRELCDTLEERISDARTRADVQEAEATRLRDRLAEARTHGADAEAEAGRRTLELASARNELGAALARGEQLDFDLRGSRSDLDKKERELREVLLTKARGEEEAMAARARIEAEVLARDGEIGRLKGRLSELEYDRNALTADVAKKTREIDDLNTQLARLSEAAKGARR